MKNLFEKTVLLVALGAMTGCCSYRFTTTMSRPAAQPNQSVKFFVKELNYPKVRRWAIPTIEGFSYESGKQLPTEISPDMLKGTISKTSTVRYPHLFSNQSDSIPLKVSVRIHDKHDPLMGLKFTAFTLTGTILHLPWSDGGIFDVSVSLFAENFTPVQIGTIAFVRKDYLWISLVSPTALLNIPGESAKPKTSSGDEALQHGGDLTVESIVDAVATILQQRDLTPEIEEYIKSQRRF